MAECPSCGCPLPTPKVEYVIHINGDTQRMADAVLAALKAYPGAKS